MNEVDFPTVLYLCLDHKEANKSIIVSQMASSQLQNIWTTLQYVHMEGELFSNKGGRRGKSRMGLDRTFFKIILLHSSMFKRIYFLEAGKDFWMRSY